MRPLILALVCLISCSGIRAAEPVDYVRDVLPILEQRCIGCHMSDDFEGGFVMEAFDQMMVGGKHGVAITPGVPNSSRMYLMAAGDLEPIMPPDGDGAMTEPELKLLATWIEQGAIGPTGNGIPKRDIRVPKLASRDDIRLPVTAIEYSPNGKLRVIARYGSVEIQAPSDGTSRTLQDKFDKVNSLDFSPDGKSLLVGSGLTGVYGRAALFNVQNGELIREFVGHRDVVFSAKFAPDGRSIATAGYDRNILIWDVATGEILKTLTGHNGAIFDLAFSPDGQTIVSACADETAKVWNVSRGERIATLGEPEGEVYAVAITPDGQQVIAASSDNRIRVWSLQTRDSVGINPLIATRFVDDSALVSFSLTPDGSAMVVLSEGGNVKILSTATWDQAGLLESLADLGSGIAIHPNGRDVSIGLLNGDIAERQIVGSDGQSTEERATQTPIYLDLGPLIAASEKELRDQQPSTDILTVPRGASITGLLKNQGARDQFAFRANQGEVWAIDADAIQGSPIDPKVAIFDAAGEPVLRVRLAAIRDTYFTFRGKNSDQSSDFRIFNWQEMNLGNYLYAAGEVSRLWMHPRGPDSGFNVYPGDGSRWTYFGTTQSTHALGEPAYIVRPLATDEVAAANGLPVFDIYYENDDDSFRNAGRNSRLVFTAPSSGQFTVVVTDARGQAGDNYAYQLTIRAAQPSFEPSVDAVKGELKRGTGREFLVRANRLDGYDGEIDFHADDLPPGVVTNLPVTIEAGQRVAVGQLWVPEDIDAWTETFTPVITATATINGKRVERNAGTLGELKLGERPQVIASIQPVDRDVAESEDWTLSVRRGETVSARVVIRRQPGFENEVSFGNELAGRNVSQGVYVDNIGLNGLLLLAGMNEREFFITADSTAEPGRRSFFLTANVDGKVTTHPITLEVLP
jgi:WD40 repeat protein